VNTVLLQSTFTCLLEITLDAHHRLVDVRRLDENRGVYYGLTRRHDEVFVVARNVSVDDRIPDPTFPSNNLLSFTWPWRNDVRSWSVPDTRGVHQARWHDGLVWLASCRDPELVAFDPLRGRVVGELALAELVPPELRHEAPAEHPMDRYHFNSLCFSADRLFVLAHNWHYGSFALELEYRGADSLFRSPRVCCVHTGLGCQSHDVYLEGGLLYVLSSLDGRLLASNGATHQLGLDSSNCFARGLAVNGAFLYAGHSIFASRENRLTGMTQITIIDRARGQTAAVVDVGPYGNPCDLLLMSEPDWSDEASFPATSGRPVVAGWRARVAG
jgi:hypothetical protein